MGCNESKDDKPVLAVTDRNSVGPNSTSQWVDPDMILELEIADSDEKDQVEHINQQLNETLTSMKQLKAMEFRPGLKKTQSAHVSNTLDSIAEMYWLEDLKLDFTKTEGKFIGVSNEVSECLDSLKSLRKFSMDISKNQYGIFLESVFLSISETIQKIEIIAGSSGLYDRNLNSLIEGLGPMKDLKKFQFSARNNNLTKNSLIIFSKVLNAWADLHPQSLSVEIDFSENVDVGEGLEELNDAVFGCRALIYFTMTLQNVNLQQLKPYKGRKKNPNLLMYRLKIAGNPAIKDEDIMIFKKSCEGCAGMIDVVCEE